MDYCHKCGVPACAALLVLAAGCVSERCYEGFDCPAPKICGPAGKCVYECSVREDCAAGFACEGHLCVVDTFDHGVDTESPEIYCPAGMALVQDLFCVDLYEAARPDSTATAPGSDGSRAVSRKGAYPWLTKDNAVAAAACTAAGKRLCEPSEWKLACSGPDGQVYSYGDEYVTDACNGIDTYGRTGFHLMPTGSFPECTNEFGVFDMNGNVWEHVAGGDGTDVRGGAYNCSDSRQYHKCSYIPGSWTPSALGFRCCRDPLFADPVEVETVESRPDVTEPLDSGWFDSFAGELPELPGTDVPAETCGPPDVQPDQPAADTVYSDMAASDAAGDVATDVSTRDAGDISAGYECPPDMSLVLPSSGVPFCMDTWEASRSDATSTSYGTSTVPVSEPGRMPWFSSAMTVAAASTACESAGKRLCGGDEWSRACGGSAGSVYVYGNSYDPAVCNSIDTFCRCDTTCGAVAECPYPHCRVQASPSGDGGPCGADFHVAATGSFPSCMNEWGVFDVNGNVWEAVAGIDGQEHFRGGAYNCSDSEALHRCDHDATWNPSAKGFRCCLDAASAGGGD